MEFSAIRDTWKDSIPEVNTGFGTPWLTGHRHLRFDDTMYSRILDSLYAPWDSPCSRLGVTYYDYLPGILCWVGLTSQHQLNPLRLGESCVGFPGVNYIHSSELGHPYPPHCVRFYDEGDAKYFFKTYCAPDLYWTYHYFLLNEDTVLLKGRHAECFEAADSLYHELPLDSFNAFIEHYRDTVELAKPAWVDSARSHIRSLELSDQFSWSRP